MSHPAALSRPTPIPFHTKPQPSFNKNFDLLIRHLHEMKNFDTAVVILPKPLLSLQLD